MYAKTPVRPSYKHLFEETQYSWSGLGSRGTSPNICKDNTRYIQIRYTLEPHAPQVQRDKVKGNLIPSPALVNR